MACVGGGAPACSILYRFFYYLSCVTLDVCVTWKGGGRPLKILPGMSILNGKSLENVPIRAAPVAGGSVCCRRSDALNTSIRSAQAPFWARKKRYF